MNTIRTQDSIGQPEKRHPVVMHCLVLALMGIAAIGIGLFLLPPTEVPPVAARGGGSAGGPQAAGVKDTAAAVNAPAEQPFDYFPAQFPMPRGDADEQPVTF
jgi:hypothetical protein